MTHPSDDELVLFVYREGGGLEEIAAHLPSCAGCRERFEMLMAVLGEVDAAAVPERDEGYGARVWARLQPRLEAERRRQPWWGSFAAAVTWPRLAASGALVALLAAAFVAGRSSVMPPAQPAAGQAEALSDAARERVMLAAVGSHLDRSRVILTEIAHRNGGGAADVSVEQETAADLVAANRLYRQAAARSGDAAVAAVLEDLERVLVEIASSPNPASHGDLARWREQIDARGLLFKVTVMGSRVRERQQDAAASRPVTKAST